MGRRKEVSMSEYAERKWLTAKEVKQIYGIGPGLLRRLDEQKEIVCRRVGGTRKFYQVKSLERILR